MNTKAIVAIVLVLLVAGAGIYMWRAEQHVHTEAGPAEQAVIYYCPMHPTVTSDKPGNCPICGMKLVKRETPAEQLAGSGAIDTSVQAVSLSPEQRVTANVRTMKVALDTHTGEMVTTGRVTFDERRLAVVSAYTAGRVERLYVNFTGEAVRRGQAVAALYSPDLFSTQQEYLLALDNRERMRKAGFTDARTAAQDLVESTRRRLSLFGMSPGQIEQLERTRKPLLATNVVSPVAGVVTRKLVVEQQYVGQGQPLLEIADLAVVWVEADVYEQQLPNIQMGQRVLITSPAIPGVEFPGTVSFIQPVLAGETRTARVRIELANRGLKLKPDMYVSARIFGAMATPHIMVPKTAIVDRGQQQFVWVQTGPSSYEPRQVTVGARHGEQTVINAGLSPGDTIVIEGAFLLDSEAQLRGATSGAASTTHTGH
jgi:membrane fusion protein, copper/silver efflux system